MTHDYAGLFQALRPETSLVIGAMVALGLDLSFFRTRSIGERARLARFIAALAVVGAIVHVNAFGPHGPVFAGVLLFDAFAHATRLGVLVLALLTLGLPITVRTTRNPAEQVAVLLFATTGFLLMAVAQQLLLAFLALELASLSLYVLAGFDKSRPESAEAGLKYFLFGAMAAAFLLFGFSLLYGITGSIEFPEIAAQLSAAGSSPLLLVAFVMILVAFGFKIAAAPFHLWAPDIYEGAPTFSTALIASASKLAGFTLFYRLLWSGLSTGVGATQYHDAAVPAWWNVLAVVSAASMLLGNLGALAQSNLRRLLAYSAIAHAGALLIGVLSASVSGPAPLFFYAFSYGLATVGAFAVIAVIELSGPCEKISDLAGLHRRSPLLAGCLAIFVLSLAGIPPLAGFFGKFVVFASALQLGGLSTPAGWLAILALGFSAVALYYYVILLKQALVAGPASGVRPIAVPFGARIALLILAGLIVAIGVWPVALLDLFSR